jgi:hypothetical protein
MPHAYQSSRYQAQRNRESQALECAMHDCLAQLGLEIHVINALRDNLNQWTVFDRIKRYFALYANDGPRCSHQTACRCPVTAFTKGEAPTPTTVVVVVPTTKAVAAPTTMATARQNPVQRTREARKSQNVD